jgi:hypothetical protein
VYILIILHTQSTPGQSQRAQCTSAGLRTHNRQRDTTAQAALTAHEHVNIWSNPGHSICCSDMRCTPCQDGNGTSHAQSTHLSPSSQVGAQRYTFQIPNTVLLLQ